MAMDETGVSGEQLGCGIRLERKTGSMEDQQVEAEGRLEEMDDIGFRRLSGFLVEDFPVEAGEPGYISVTRIGEAYYP